ncbi:hypothetical protein [Aestuariivivens sediminicola]|uniref:hypothetical protein n=1 Tax=Aestuariivivens sediminicola TaxID=2913560 RepID=UPI001F571A36|nr:hypothetical protein [Aestuariivivens sediminicola]
MYLRYQFVFLLSLLLMGCASRLNRNAKTGKHAERHQLVHSTETDASSSRARDGNSGGPESNPQASGHSGDALSETDNVIGEDYGSSQVTHNNDSEPLENMVPISPVAQRMVENYINSDNKMPGGHCLRVSKRRFDRAYREVYGHSVYRDLPERIATPYYTPKEVFDFLYYSASGTHIGWQSLPIEYRGRGNAGAIVYAGMGTLVDSLGIWGGQLRPGAMLQVWRYRSDYELVVQGTNDKDFDPYGHSFIFMGYVRDENNAIKGLRIADQGFQSYRPLNPNDYEVWWGVNLSI